MTPLQKTFLAATALVAVLGLSGCDNTSYYEQRAQINAQTIDNVREEGIKVERLDVPAALQRLPQGYYKVDVPSQDGPMSCIANVNHYGNGVKNVILDCN